jgi:hypothetical protein
LELSQGLRNLTPQLRKNEEALIPRRDPKQEKKEGKERDKTSGMNEVYVT